MMSKTYDPFLLDGPLVLAVSLLVAGALLFLMMLILVAEGSRILAACVSVMMVLYFVGAGYMIRFIQEGEDNGEETEEGDKEARA
jgi:uncharacterized protein YebE (UPF0316 family)